MLWDTPSGILKIWEYARYQQSLDANNPKQSIWRLRTWRPSSPMLWDLEFVNNISLTTKSSCCVFTYPRKYLYVLTCLNMSYSLSQSSQVLFHNRKLLKHQPAVQDLVGPWKPECVSWMISGGPLPRLFEGVSMRVPQELPWITHDDNIIEINSK